MWNPRTEKGILATLRQGKAVTLVADLLRESENFFADVEVACEDLQKKIAAGDPGASEESSGKKSRRAWTELRIRQPDLVTDNVTLPIQRLREAVSELIKLTEDKDTGQELVECNRRLTELREEVAMFLSQSAEDYVYWVERAGKTQKNLALNAAPIDVADFLRRRLFSVDTSVIMTSATLAISERRSNDAAPEKTKTRSATRSPKHATRSQAFPISSTASAPRNPSNSRSARHSITRSR